MKANFAVPNAQLLVDKSCSVVKIHNLMDKNKYAVHFIHHLSMNLSDRGPLRAGGKTLYLHEHGYTNISNNYHLHPQTSLIHFSILTCKLCIPTTQGCLIIFSTLGLLLKSFSRLLVKSELRGNTPITQEMSE
jgi:hypothetical protein